ncbi:FHA domain-containing protein [Massilia sp.]|uniref:FHA domain-containing protein n=1 Tax=Massilia sp. TaxID=1882437 RepID=UPI0028B1DBE8|nr:FHA domain-containing protein [Massilia sp.]
MNRCANPEHPHCTVWVMPGDESCAHGHPQPAFASAAGEPAAAAAPLSPPIPAPALQRPHLHVSGFDPRAAGGRQVLKLELRGMPPDCAPQVTLLANSRLRLQGGERHGGPLSFTRTLRGDWLPAFLEFSSRGLEHGQYRVELELHSRAQPARSWQATLLILVPRLDASLHEIHQTFLATHKNVRVSADDAAIARVNARTGGGRVDIDVAASNAGIAHLDLDARGGKIDLGFSSIAWDEDLLEVDLPAQAAAHPCPASSACLEFAAAPEGGVRRLRLFALDECVLGRHDGEADIRLMHHLDGGPTPDGLTRRLSARHVLVRRGRAGFEIEDVSRYGLLVDGAWPGKHQCVPLRPGMRIELTASIPGVAVLEVTAVLPNAVLLHRLDAGMGHEAFCILAPERDADFAPRLAALGLPLLFHRDGGFWHADPASGVSTPLTPATAVERLPGWPRGARFSARAYPEERNGQAARAASPAQVT